MPTVTLDRTEFTYICISLVHLSTAASEPKSTDLLTWRHIIATALAREHGLLGSSVLVDILHHESPTASEPEKIIIRIPKGDTRMVWNSISSWSDIATGKAMRVLKVSDHLTAIL